MTTTTSEDAAWTGWVNDAGRVPGDGTGIPTA